MSSRPEGQLTLFIYTLGGLDKVLGMIMAALFVGETEGLRAPEFVELLDGALGQLREAEAYDLEPQVIDLVGETRAKTTQLEKHLRSKESSRADDVVGGRMGPEPLSLLDDVYAGLEMTLECVKSAKPWSSLPRRQRNHVVSTLRNVRESRRMIQHRGERFLAGASFWRRASYWVARFQTWLGDRFA